MDFNPQLNGEIEQEMAGTAVAESRLTNLTKGAIEYGNIRATARQVGRLQRRTFDIVEAFFLGGRGRLLDERVASLQGMEPRRPAAPSFGAVLQFQRQSTIGELTLPAGATVATKSGLKFKITESRVSADGDSQLPLVDGDLVPCVCMTPGFVGNVAVGEISELASVPGGWASVTNVAALSNGLERETDDQLRQRAGEYLSSLNGVQVDAVQYLLRSLVGDNGERFLHVECHEDVETRALSTVVVDDGTGTLGTMSRDAIAHTGTLPDEPPDELSFDWPALSRPQLYVAGVPITDERWSWVEERGVVRFNGFTDALTAGETYSISDHRVSIGLLAKAQAAIEGVSGLVFGRPGWRANGCRVILKAADAWWLDFRVQFSAKPGFSRDSVRSRIRGGVVAFMNALGPRRPFIHAALVAALMALPGVDDVVVLAPSGNRFAPSEGFYSLSTTPDRVTV